MMRIRLIAQNQTSDAVAENGIDLMTFLRAQGHLVPAPCGGRGNCGKCLVEIDDIGPVLACQTVIGKDVTTPEGKSDDTAPDLIVRLPTPAKAMILIDGLMSHHSLNPLIRHVSTQVQQPTLESQLADDVRFFKACGYHVPFGLLSQLPGVLTEDGGRVDFIGRADTMTVLRFLTSEKDRSANVRPILLGIAIDIGTTTLAGYLYDLNDGRRLASAAMVNPQVTFGADVISRIARASISDKERAAVQASIQQAVTKLSVQLLNQTDKPYGLSPMLQDVIQICIAGNTTMIHLLAGLPALHISMAPFNPVTTRAWTVLASDIGLKAFPQAICTILPSVASYVGADITAGIVALGLEHPRHETALLIDIGTNGEIVFRSGERLSACATAAGPAFEGADISSGMSGVAGAIDHVWMNGDDLCYSVISRESFSISSCDEMAPSDMELPLGICGSGLIDLVAVLLKTGVIDETGRIGDEEANLSESMQQRLTTVNGQPAFLLATATENGQDRPILLTQKDVRELQNAKAAIASGILLLLHRESIDPSTVKTIYLAGGFGQYLNIRSARAIGLLPETLAGHVVSAGNTAAMGAIRVLLDWTLLQSCQETADAVIYRELSSDPQFTDLFIDTMLFPEVS